MSGERKTIRLPGGMTVCNVPVREARILVARGAFAEKYCKEHGWKLEEITIPQLLEIRDQPGWKSPT